MVYASILQKYFEATPFELEEGSSGYNNTTRYVTCRGERYVLRIYETHRDSSKIRFEHETLMKFNELELPFLVPLPIRARTGMTFVPLEDGSGRYACLFQYREGVRPDSRNAATASAVGHTVGKLSVALSTIEVNLATEYPPYYEMDIAHPSCDPESVRRFCQNPPAVFSGLGEELGAIQQELGDFRAYLPELRQLPHQLVHGDINDSNLLAAADDPNRIAVVLDFEFCTRDLRAMEPAVVLSGMLEGEKRDETIPVFLAGFSANVRVSEAEARAIPLLIRLRKLDVFVHFLGRYLDGVDAPSVLEEQIVDAAKGLAELRNLEKRLEQWCLMMTL